MYGLTLKKIITVVENDKWKFDKKNDRSDEQRKLVNIFDEMVKSSFWSNKIR